MKLYLTNIFIFITAFSFGQGFNNDQKYDQQDLDFLFKKNGIEVFKFPFKSKIDSGINIIIEEYSNYKLIQTHNLYKDFMPMFKMLDEPISFFFPKMNDSIAQYLRFYLTKNSSGFKLSVKTSKIEREYSFVAKDIILTQTRAFDYIPSFIEKRQPLFVFYGTKNRDLISCPGDAAVEKVVKMYDYLVVVYADILK